MLIEIDNQLFEVNHIACVKPSGLNKSQTVIFTVGQSTIDGGFLVNTPYKTVVKQLREAKLTDLMEMIEYMDAGMDHGEDDDDDGGNVGESTDDSSVN